VELKDDYKSQVRRYTAKYPNLKPSAVKIYVRLFRTELDKKRVGMIKKSELKNWIKANNVHLEESAVNELLTSLDHKGERITMDNFIDIMCGQSARTKENETRELFKSFDMDGDGIISKSELKTGMKNIFGKDISEDKLTMMIKQADSTGRGGIGYNDFCKMMKG